MKERAGKDFATNPETLFIPKRISFSEHDILLNVHPKCEYKVKDYRAAKG